MANKSSKSKVPVTETPREFGLRLPPRTTVYDLMIALQRCPPDAVIVMSADEEGNGYAGLAQLDVNAPMKHTRTPWGDRYEPVLTELGDSMEGAKRCVILWP